MAPIDAVLGTARRVGEQRLAVWANEGFARRLWDKDPTLWFDPPREGIANRLGWLDLPEQSRGGLEELTSFAAEVRTAGYRDVVLAGMGGSSLAPEVYAATFGSAPEHPALAVLDSTHPQAVTRVGAAIDPASTLFLVSSKSGTTLETLSFFRYFWQQVEAVSADAGANFVAITDPGSSLAELAAERGFRRTFLANPDVGGRYSALSVFGLVPAALIGVDLGRLLASAAAMAAASGPAVPEADNPGLALGATLGELAAAGRNKLTLVVSQSLRAFPAWWEQLVAESTGKDGAGILPVADEPLGPPSVYGPDRVFLYAALNADRDDDQRLALDALEAAGHPVIRIRLEEKEDLGREMLRAELAVAAAGAVLRIHPFDQPDVEGAKRLARAAMAGGGEAEVEEVAPGPVVREFLSGAASNGYLAVHAYLAPAPEVDAALERIRLAVRERSHIATTVGYGPRFLHSTGQLHKGGPAGGVFLQLVDRPEADVPVPETDFTFGQLIRAQSIGDLGALQAAGRQVLRVQLGGDRSAGLAELVAAVDG